MGRNQIVKHHLIRWGYLDQNVNYLEGYELVRIKVLYSALKELSSEERLFLAEKYRVLPKRISDAVLAERHGMELKEYREKRIAIETKLEPIMTRYKNEMYTSSREKDMDLKRCKKLSRERIEFSNTVTLAILNGENK